MSASGRGLLGDDHRASVDASFSNVMRPHRFVGASVAYFRMGDRGRLIRIAEPATDRLEQVPEQLRSSGLDARVQQDPATREQNRAAAVDVPAEAPEQLAHLKVTLFIFQVEGGGLVCGNVAVESVPLNGQRGQFEDGPPVPVGAGVWRRLRIGELVEEAIESVRAFSTSMASRLPADLVGADANLRDVLGIYRNLAGEDRGRTRPGPKSLMTDALLREIVVPAYLSGGRKGLQSVQRALQAAGYPGSGPSFNVTNDQARAAVRKARALGMIPSANPKDGR